MNITEAKDIVHELAWKSNLTEDEEFMLIEAWGYLIEKTHETRWMVGLGGYYYEKKEFDLALKYYEMADSYGDEWAPEGLGYIWYYGRTGEKDYEKAFKYYSKAAENGMIKSKIKVADMYRNGYYVEKDYDKYVRLVEEVYREVKNSTFPGDPVSEVFTRLARIRKEQGYEDEAVRLYLEARSFQAQRLCYNPFFGDLNIMKWLIEDLYELIEVDYADIDLYDLFYLLKKPVRISFRMIDSDEEYVVEGVEEEGGVSVRFGDQWYRSVDDFFRQATVDGELIPVMYESLHDFKVV